MTSARAFRCMCPSRPSAPAAGPISAMSALRRPARFPVRRSTSDPSEIRDFAYTMIRVLDDKGEAVGDGRGR